jgi:hypothetical protein
VYQIRHCCQPRGPAKWTAPREMKFTSATAACVGVDESHVFPVSRSPWLCGKTQVRTTPVLLNDDLDIGDHRHIHLLQKVL